MIEAHTKLRTCSRLAGVALVCALGVSSAAQAGVGADRRASARTAIFDRFDSNRLDTRLWRHWWGSATVDRGMLTLSSAPSWRASETHSSLVVTHRSWRNLRLSVVVNPIRQLRHTDVPNSWETGWIMFRFRGVWDYYYFTLKPTGWELGKKQGSDAQIFLATGSAPKLRIGDRARITIQAVGPRIRVFVNGARILDFVDPRPLRSGAVGLYEEDATVRFGDVAVASA